MLTTRVVLQTEFSSVSHQVSQISPNSLLCGDTQHLLEDLTGTVFQLSVKYLSSATFKTQAAVSLSSVV